MPYTSMLDPEARYVGQNSPLLGSLSAGYIPGRRNMLGRGNLQPEEPKRSKYTDMDPFELAGLTNEYMIKAAQAPFIANFPDYLGLNQQRSSNIGANLRGEVPSDVMNQIIRAGAERGVLTGMPGSPNSNAAWLQALGLTSLGQQEKGASQFNEAVASTPVPELSNPMSLIAAERLAQMELDAYNRRNQPMNMGGGTTYRNLGGGGGIYTPSTTSRWGGAAGATGGTPSHGNWVGPRVTVQPSFSNGPSDFSDWWDAPQVSQGPSDFSDWWDAPAAPAVSPGPSDFSDWWED